MSPKSDSITKEQIGSAFDNDTTILIDEETDEETFIAKTPKTCQCDCQLRIADLLS